MKNSTKILLILGPIGVIVFLIVSKFSPMGIYDFLNISRDYPNTLYVAFVIALPFTIYYFVHLYSNKLSKNKANWVYFLIFFPTITQVLYWFKYIKDE